MSLKILNLSRRAFARAELAELGFLQGIGRRRALVVQLILKSIDLFLECRHLSAQILFVFDSHRCELASKFGDFCVARFLDALAFKHELFLLGGVLLNLCAQFCELNFGIVELLLSALEFALNEVSVLLGFNLEEVELFRDEVFGHATAFQFSESVVELFSERVILIIHFLPGLDQRRTSLTHAGGFFAEFATSDIVFGSKFFQLNFEPLNYRRLRRNLQAHLILHAQYFFRSGVGSVSRGGCFSFTNCEFIS